MIRVAKKYTEEAEVVNTIVTNMDRLLHEVGKGIMLKWLKLLLPSIEVDNYQREYLRARVQDDIMVTQYEVRKVVRFWAGEIPSVTMVMYMIHVLLTPG